MTLKFLKYQYDNQVMKDNRLSIKKNQARRYDKEIDTAVLTEETIKIYIERAGFSVDEKTICMIILNGEKLVKEMAADIAV